MALKKEKADLQQRTHHLSSIVAHALEYSEAGEQTKRHEAMEVLQATERLRSFLDSVEAFAEPQGRTPAISTVFADSLFPSLPQGQPDALMLCQA